MELYLRLSPPEEWATDPDEREVSFMDCKFNTDLGLVTVNDDVIVRVAGYAALDCFPGARTPRGEG